MALVGKIRNNWTELQTCFAATIDRMQYCYMTCGFQKDATIICLKWRIKKNKEEEEEE